MRRASRNDRGGQVQAERLAGSGIGAGQRVDGGNGFGFGFDTTGGKRSHSFPLHNRAKLDFADRSDNQVQSHPLARGYTFRYASVNDPNNPLTIE